MDLLGGKRHRKRTVKRTIKRTKRGKRGKSKNTVRRHKRR